MTCTPTRSASTWRRCGRRSARGVHATATARSGGPSTAGRPCPQAPSLGLEPAVPAARPPAGRGGGRGAGSTPDRGRGGGPAPGTGAAPPGRAWRRRAAAVGVRAGGDGRAGRPGLRPRPRRRRARTWTRSTISFTHCPFRELAGSTPTWCASCTGASPRASWPAPSAATPGAVGPGRVVRQPGGRRPLPGRAVVRLNAADQRVACPQSARRARLRLSRRTGEHHPDRRHPHRGHHPHRRLPRPRSPS